MLWICLACTTAYAVGCERCPYCGSAEYAEEGTEMPKITRHGGASNKATGPAKVELVGERGPDGIVANPVLNTGGEDGPELVVALEDGRRMAVVGEQGPELVDVSAGTTVTLVEAPANVSPYDGMLRTDLQELCRTRGLASSGNKDELVARLVAADSAKAEQDSDDS